MKILFASLCLLLSACAQPPSADVAIRGATVVDVASGMLVPDQTLLIAGKRIAAFGPTEELSVPPGADVVDAVGGLSDPRPSGRASSNESE